MGEVRAHVVIGVDRFEALALVVGDGARNRTVHDREPGERRHAARDQLAGLGPVGMRVHRDVRPEAQVIGVAPYRGGRVPGNVHGPRQSFDVGADGEGDAVGVPCGRGDDLGSGGSDVDGDLDETFSQPSKAAALRAARHVQRVGGFDLPCAVEFDIERNVVAT